MALVAEYFIDEGTGTTVGDNQASPVNLTISTGTGSGWTSISEGAGYDFNQTATAESGNITSSNKIWQALNSTTYTVIVVLRNDDQASTQSIFGIREDDFSQSPVRCRLNGDSAGGGNENTVRWIWSQASGGPFWQSAANVVTVSTVYAFAFVFDSSNGTSADRCRVYRTPAGSSFARLTPASFTEPTSGQTTDFSTVTNAVFQIASVVGIQPFNGGIFYLGLWDEVLDETTLEDFMDQLLADNDATPTASSSFTSTVAATWSGFTGSATAAETFPSTVAATWAGFAGAATADSGSVFPCTVAASLAGFTGAATATETLPSTVAAEWSPLVGAATVAETFASSAAATWPEWACAAEAASGGIPPISGTVAATWSGFAGAATTSEALPCTVAGEFAAFACNASVTMAPPVTSTAAATWAGWGASADLDNDSGGGEEHAGRNRGRRRWRGYSPQ